MACKWYDKEWGDLATLEYGRALRGYEAAGGAYRVYGTNGPIGWHPESLADHATVVVGRKGAYRGIHYSPAPCWVIDTAFFLESKTDFDMQWAYYELLTHDINSMDSGSAIPSTSRDAFYRLPVRVPPKNEQRAIAHILGMLDDKIELNWRTNETLEAIARAIFKSWFVDFDSVRAKAKGRDPGLPKHIVELFPDRFVDSQLGDIPKGWRVSRLGMEVTTLLGGTPSRAEPAYWGGSIPWINSGKANEFRIVEASEWITEAGLNASATKLLPARTTVIAITGATLGQVSLTEIETCANQSIVGVLGNPGLPSEFIYFWVKQNIQDLLAWQTGGAQQHINKNNVNDLAVICSSPPLMNEYVRQVRPMFDRMRDCCFESRTLAALRDTLLPKLISGELRLKDAERLHGSAI